MPDLTTLAHAHIRAGLPSDLTIRQLALLGIMADGQADRVRHFADAILPAKPVVTRAIKSFVTDGLVERRRDPEDGRDVAISLTGQGRVLVERIGGLAA